MVFLDFVGDDLDLERRFVEGSVFSCRGIIGIVAGRLEWDFRCFLRF